MAITITTYPGNQQVYVEWTDDNPANFDYDLFVDGGSGGGEVLVGNNVYFGQLIQGLVNGREYTFRLDSNYTTDEGSETATPAAVPNVYPPTSLVMDTPSTGAVTITSYTKDTYYDTAGWTHNLYRSVSGAGTFSRIYSGTSFSPDVFGIDGETWDFKLTLTDGSGNESGFSNTASVVIASAVAPSAPTGIYYLGEGLYSVADRGSTDVVKVALSGATGETDYTLAPSFTATATALYVTADPVPGAPASATAYFVGRGGLSGTSFGGTVLTPTIPERTGGTVAPVVTSLGVSAFTITGATAEPDPVNYPGNHVIYRDGVRIALLAGSTFDTEGTITRNEGSVSGGVPVTLPARAFWERGRPYDVGTKTGSTSVVRTYRIPSLSFPDARDVDDIRLAWTPDLQATGYKVYRDDVEIATVDALGPWRGGLSLDIEAGDANGWYTDSGIDPDTEYTYTVSTVYSGTWGTWETPQSNERTVYLLGEDCTYEIDPTERAVTADAHPGLTFAVTVTMGGE
ncbi:MAG: hypothetical protein V4671_06135 [Armatimonadota bacterium]